MRKLGVLGVRVRVGDPEHQVLVVLCEADGAMSLPIIIGPHEGVAIATAHAGVASPRPGPYDLVLATLDATGVALEYAMICDLRDGTFFAELVLTNGKRLDCRASDAIALALRARVDVWCSDAVFDEAAVVVHHEGADGEQGGEEMSSSNGVRADEAVAQFREFLNHVDASDFDEPHESGPTPSS